MQFPLFILVQMFIKYNELAFYKYSLGFNLGKVWWEGEGGLTLVPKVILHDAVFAVGRFHGHHVGQPKDGDHARWKLSKL